MQRMSISEYRQHVATSSVNARGRVVAVEPLKTDEPKPSKYLNKKTEIDGIIFDSAREGEHYKKLVMLQKCGRISDLRLQPKYELHVNGIKVCSYVADFSYVEDGKTVVCDAKGMKTPMYRLKKKMLKAEYGITILEV